MWIEAASPCLRRAGGAVRVRLDIASDSQPDFGELRASHPTAEAIFLKLHTSPRRRGIAGDGGRSFPGKAILDSDFRKLGPEPPYGPVGCSAAQRQRILVIDDSVSY